MAIKSMTGYARQDASAVGLSWTVELKSVNGKGFDLRSRLPQSFEAYEGELRKLIADTVKRGNVNLAIAENGDESTTEVRIDAAVLEQYFATARELHERHGLALPSSAELLQLRGVTNLRGRELDEAETQQLGAAIAASVERACAALDTARRNEGREIAEAIESVVAEIEHLVTAAEELAASQVAVIRQRFAEKLALIEADSAPVEPDRVAQEVAVIATKADVREEIDRLRAHVSAARTALGEDGPVGRKLEFLGQEFIREANTLCAKAAEMELTRIGLDLKSVIEQFREQIRNIE